MQRYFLTQDYIEGEMIALTGEEFHHAIHVMRMNTGDRCYLVFQKGLSIVAEIKEIDSDQAWLVECEKEAEEKELPLEITIACGYPKKDKLDWIVQKATELGVDQIIGFPAKYSVVKWDTKKIQKKVDRLQKIAKEAAEQAHRQHLPCVQMLETQQVLREKRQDFDQIWIAYEEEAKQGTHTKLAQLLHSSQKKERILVIFGPEGGLSEEEVTWWQEQGAECMSLGPRILRTETAPLYLLSAVSYEWELSRTLH